MTDLHTFLARIGLSHLASKLEEEAIETLEDLAFLEKSDYLHMGLKIGHANRIRRALAETQAAGSLADSFGGSSGGISDQETAMPGSPAPAPSAPAALSPAPTTLGVGSRLGSFELRAELGTGSFGKVYQAFDHDLQQPVALKVIHTRGPASVALESLSQEFRVRDRITDRQHILVVERPRTEQAGGRALVVLPMEYADGGSFDAWLRTRTSAEDRQDEALALFAQACRGVAAIHAAGVTHLDLKPANLLLVGGTVKVADFGLSRDLDRLGAVPDGLLQDGVGSPAYMAPEQILAARPQDVGPAADLWALGVILFEILDGERPFSGTNPDALKAKILDPRLRVSTRRIPEAYRELVAGLLERDEAARIGDVAEVLERLQGPDVAPATPESRMPARVDVELVDAVVEAFETVGTSGAIRVEPGVGAESRLEVTDGMRLDRGYLSPFFVTDADAGVAEHREAYVLLCHDEITGLKDLLPLLEQVAKESAPLCIIARDVNSSVLQTLVTNQERGTLQVVAVKAMGFGDRRDGILEDLAVLLGGTSFRTQAEFAEADLGQLGRCGTLVVSADETHLIDARGEEAAIRERAEELRRWIEETASDYDREKLQERLASLIGGYAVIRVGAPRADAIAQKTAQARELLERARALLPEVGSIQELRARLVDA